MRNPLALSIALGLLAASAPLGAEMSVRPDGAPGMPGGAYLQCVPYAREVSGVQIYGDAHTWWDQADGRYARGRTPRVGAVMAFEPHRNMRLGHVAAVSRIVDSRTLLLRHANWSEIDGRRGQIEDNVRAMDVSPNNDWSQVRVWYAPIEALGGTAWPVHGFIYNEQPGAAARTSVASAAPGTNRTAASPRRPRSQRGARPARAARQGGFSAAMAMDELPPRDSFEASFSFLD